MQQSNKVVGNRCLFVTNFSLDSGVFSGKQKCAAVVLVWKIQNTKNYEEHRPINMILVYEVVVKKQLCEHLETN